MERLKKTIEAFVMDWEELEEIEKFLIQAAIQVRRNAQAPYSNFYVGAAVLNADGEVFEGCNVERVSWTQTTHAEQNAVDNMVANRGAKKVKMVAVVAAPKDFEFITPPDSKDSEITQFEQVGSPCGHCLQIIWENCFNDPEVSILVLHPNGKITRTTMGNVLPVRFGPGDLGIELS